MSSGFDTRMVSMIGSDSRFWGVIERLKYRIAGVLGRFMIQAVGRSMRVVGWTGRRLVPDEQVIIVFWHNKLFYMSYCVAARCIQKGRKVAVLISSSRDGEYMARAAEKLGAKVVRGSSSRRGEAGFRKLCRWAERGASLCVAPDGPKGPRYEVKEGTIYLAQKTGLPILPVSYRAKETLTLKSWDGFILPLPFTSVEMRCADPIHVPGDLGPKERESFCSTLRDKLMDLE